MIIELYLRSDGRVTGSRLAVLALNVPGKLVVILVFIIKMNGVTGRINLLLFSTVVPSIICMFMSCRPFVVITTLSTGLVGVEVISVSWLGQLTVGV